MCVCVYEKREEDGYVGRVGGLDPQDTHERGLGPLPLPREHL